MAAESTNELVDAIKSLTEEQQAEVADVLSPHLQPSIGRRQMLGIGGATGLAALLGGSAPVAASQAIGPAAAADGVLSDINVLESGDGTPMEFGNAVAFDHEAVSSSTTIGNVTTIEYDSSVAGFTITIPTTLEIHGMVLEFVDVGGSAGTNSVDVTTASGNNIDGQGTVTLDASSSYYRIVWRDGEWTSRIFTERVDAGTITTGQGTFNDAAADPSSNGELQRNGTDLKAFSGGAVRNLSDIGGGGGGTTFIESQSPSGVSSADFTSSFANHEAHVFVLHNIIPATDAVQCLLRTSTDSGANWDSGASDYKWAARRSNSAAQSADDGGTASQIVISENTIGSASGEDGVSGTVTLYGSGLTNRTFVTYVISQIDSGGSLNSVVGSGMRDAAEDVTGVRFLFSSGNIESGTIEHLGVN